MQEKDRDNWASAALSSLVGHTFAAYAGAS
jgi:hypothetical protein